MNEGNTVLVQLYMTSMTVCQRRARFHYGRHTGKVTKCKMSVMDLVSTIAALPDCVLKHAFSLFKDIVCFFV